MGLSEKRWMRVSTWSWPFPFGVRLGWASSVPNPDLHRARGRAYLFRGQGIIFSRGLATLRDDLRRDEIWTEDLRCMGDSWACRHILAQRVGPIIFVGHSCGGRAALFAAKQLEQAGIEVDLVVCLDVAFPSMVPGNVRKAVHLYLTERRIYPAHPLQALNPAVVTNIDLSDLNLNHLTITNSPQVQALVLKHTRETLDAGHVNSPAKS